MLSSLICLVGGSEVGGGEGVGGGDCWDGVAEQASQVQSLFSLIYLIKSPHHFEFIHPDHLLHF